MTLTPRQKKLLKNSISGCVYGYVIGNAMGATSDLMTAQDIKSKFGKIRKIVGGGPCYTNKGEVTDEAALTLCLMDLLVDFDFSKSVDEFKTECADSFVESMKTKPMFLDAGTARAIKHYESNDEFMPECQYSTSVGGLSRAMPCAVLGNSILNKAQTEITHNNRIVLKVVRRYTSIVKQIIRTSAYSDCFRNADNFKHFLHDYGGINLLVVRKPQASLLSDKAFDNALLYSSEDSFTDCAIAAVNDGISSSVTASIACSICGARLGFSSIPYKYVASLDVDLLPRLGKFISFATDYVISNF